MREGTMDKTKKAPIIVSRPYLVPHTDHMEDFQEWYARNLVKHNLIVATRYYRALHQAQAAAVTVALRKGASHILFTECDHYRYPEDGLEVLLEADKDVIGFRTYKRDYPYSNMNMRKARPDVSMILPQWEMKAKGAYLEAFGWEKGDDIIQKTDLITWAFTLVKVDVFRRMSQAWGNRLVSQEDLKALIQGDDATKDRLREYIKRPEGLQPFRQWGPHPTDSFFCQYCEDLGIDRHVHFGWTIAHGDVDPENTFTRRNRDVVELFQDNAMTPVEDDWGNTYGPDLDVRPDNRIPITREQAINGKASSQKSDAGKEGDRQEDTDKQGSGEEAGRREAAVLHA
jgi:hypothetical protein